MKQKITLLKVLLTLVLLCGVGNAWGETKKEGFEKASTSTNYQGTVTVESTKSDCGIGWKIYYGTVSTSSKISGNNSAALRLYTSNNYGYIMTTTPIDGLTKVSFNVKASTSNDAKILYDVFCSADKETWTLIGSKIAPGATSSNKSYDVTDGSKYIKIEINSNSTKPKSGNAQLTIDDVEFTYTAPQTDPFVVTFDAGTNGTCSTSSLTEASAGAGITLPSCTAKDGYVFKGWSTTENGTTADAGMAGATYKPSSDCTLYAVYNKLYTVTYYSLGVQLGYEKVEESGTVAKAPSSVTPPTGWSFAGWTTDKNYAMSTTAPVLFKETTPVDKDYILYAVFKYTVAGSVSYEKVTSTLTDWRGDYLIAYSSSIFMDGSLDGGKEGVGKAQSHVSPGDALNGTTITADWGNEHYVTLEAIDDADLSKGYVIKSHSTQTPYFYQTSNANGMSSTDNKSTAANYPISIVFNSENDIDIALGGAATGAILHYNNAVGATGEMFRFYKDGGQQNIHLYKKNDLSVTHYTINEPRTQSVTITSARYATAYIPFNATISNEANDVKAYYVTVLGNNAQLNEIEGTIPANKGVVLKGSAGTVTFTESAVTPTTDVSENKMVGSLVDKTFSDAKYVYYRLANNNGNVGFYKQNAEGWAKCDAGKAVLEVPVTAAPSFFTFDDATAINAISNVKTSSVRYNLNGQAVGEDYNGIVIVNGKKMFNK